MEILFLCIVIFLFMLAVFDLSVGVSNDAVNFLNSALGSRAASVKTIMAVASVGIFLGAALSNGMMDIARHGIFRPEHMSFYDVLCIFMAVMVTDIILLDVFNSLGMPTSTTVSMVFELLGASFVVALIKIGGDGSGLGLADFLNAEKALSVILGIFLSVAIAFVFGTVVQMVARFIFTFGYRSRLKWKIGLFGGICVTAIVYFLLLKGLKDMSFMTPAVKAWTGAHTAEVLAGCLVVFTLVSQLLHALGVNVLRLVVLTGTFALAMAFAGNDLVNFIGVPLSGLSSYQDYISNGGGDMHGYMMHSLNGPADTPLWMLVGAGAVMVVSLATSKKARRVSQTEIGLGSQSGGDEMFGSSRIARRLVRWALAAIRRVQSAMPAPVRRMLARRFDTSAACLEPDAAFDMVRAAVNLVLAGALIATGTSLKLPLSTTFVTFMVAMGTSLADRAWSRESAVFRVTGVISVIGGWFITAGAAFLGAGAVVLAMHYGGKWVMILLAAATVVVIVRSNLRFRSRDDSEQDDALFRTIAGSAPSAEQWPLLSLYMRGRQVVFLRFIADSYRSLADGFVADSAAVLARVERSLAGCKRTLKNDRRKETLCLRHVPRETAICKNSWFYLSNNCCMSVLYNMRRIAEVCREHVDNNFTPLPRRYAADLAGVRDSVAALIADVAAVAESGRCDEVETLRRRCDTVKNGLSGSYQRLYDHLREGDASQMTVVYVYLNFLQETREMVSTLRKYLRALERL